MVWLGFQNKLCSQKFVKKDFRNSKKNYKSTKFCLTNFLLGVKNYLKRVFTGILPVLGEEGGWWNNFGDPLIKFLLEEKICCQLAYSQ